MVGDQISGIARHVQNSGLRTIGCQAFRQLASTDDRHDYIGKEEMNGAAVLARGLNRSFSIRGADDRIPGAYQASAREFAHGIVVFDQKDSFHATGTGHRVW